MKKRTGRINSTETTRPLQKNDLPAALALVESVGWNQTERDLQLFLEDNGSLYLAAEIQDQVVGTVAAIDYDGAVAWISMMIVAEAFRGRGISKLLLRTVIEQLRVRDYRAVKLDATPAGRPVYRKLGFREEYVMHRLVHDRWPGERQISSSPAVRKMTDSDLPQLVRLDEAVFGAGRPALLARLLEEKYGYVYEKAGAIIAYVFGRPGRRFYQIGPAGGADPACVQLLLETILSDLRGRPVVVDVLADKTYLVNWFNALGFTFQRPFYRMYLEAGNITGRPEDHYLIAGPEFG